MIIHDFVNIAAHLPVMAGDRPHALAVVCPAGRDRSGRARHTHWTFRQLDRESDALARGLAAIGIGRGARTVLMVKPSLEFFALTFALFKAGAVPVLIDPGLGIKDLGPCLAEAAPEAFIGIPKAQAARWVLGWGRATIRRVVTVGPRQPGGGWTLEDVRRAGLRPGLADAPFEVARTTPAEVAAILFTSGSTGVPKGAVYTHAIFAAQVEMLRTLYAIEPGEIDLCTFPLFALFAPALGMTSIIPEMDATRPARVDPTKVLEAVEDFGVTNLFGSPALIRRVGEYGAARGTSLPTLRRAISAGAPVPARVLETFATMLDPRARIFTPYGATEALPVTSIASDEVLGETRHATDRGAGVCIGRPVEGVRVAIIRTSDAPIAEWSDDLLVPDGEVGEIAVQGPNVTCEYFHRPEATTLAKIADPASGSFFHRMGDLGYRDDRGRLWFCGRKAHRVVTPHATMFTIPCEAVFNTHPDVARTALVGVGKPGASRPVLCVELARPAGREREARLAWRPSRPDKDLTDRVRRELLERATSFEHTKEIETILFHPSFPVDIRHNAKIFREKLAGWAARMLG